MQFKRKHMTIPVIIAFIGAILSALGAVLASLDQAKESERNSALNQKLADKSDEIAKKSDQYAAKIDDYSKKQAERDNEIKSLQRQLIEKAEAQNQKTEQIAKLNGKLAEKSDEIAKLSLETINNFTGSNSYCYVDIAPVGGGVAQVMLTHEGSYPLSEVKIKIERVSVLKQIRSDKVSISDYLDDRSKKANNYNVSVLPTDNDRPEKTAFLLWKIPFTEGIDETYQIQFFARNGVWNQKYKFRYNNKGELKTSFTVGRPPIKGKETKYVIFKEETDPGFVDN
jgi:hypothetical protein